MTIPSDTKSMWASLILSNLCLGRCPRCCKRSYSGLCSLCRSAPALTQTTPLGLPAFALGIYDSALGDSVRKLKYQEQTIYAAHLGAALGHILPEYFRDAVLLPIPLHPIKLANRGFNQSALLARACGKTSSMKVSFDTVERREETTSQARLSRKDRVSNMQSAFSVVRPARDAPHSHRVVLLDDVITTGSTIDACASTLNQAGYKAIGVISCVFSNSNKEGITLQAKKR